MIPETSIQEAVALYSKMVAAGQGAMVYAHADPVAMASAFMAFGRQLGVQVQTILDLRASNEELTDLITEYTKRHLQPAPPEEEITGVHWQGSSGDYYDHFEAINHELAKGISQMAQQQLAKRHPSHEDAIDTTESCTETPE